MLHIYAFFSAQCIFLPCIMELTMRNTDIAKDNRVLPNTNTMAGSLSCLKTRF